jgi:hypothetical protein
MVALSYVGASRKPNDAAAHLVPRSRVLDHTSFCSEAQELASSNPNAIEPMAFAVCGLAAV